ADPSGRHSRQAGDHAGKQAAPDILDAGHQYLASVAGVPQERLRRVIAFAPEGHNRQVRLPVMVSKMQAKTEEVKGQDTSAAAPSPLPAANRALPVPKPK